MAKKKSDKKKEKAEKTGYQVTVDSSVMSLCMLVYNETLVWSYGSDDEKERVAAYQSEIDEIKSKLDACPDDDASKVLLSGDLTAVAEQLNTYCTEVVEAKHYDEVLYSRCESVDVDEYQVSCIQHRSKSNDDFFAPHDKKIHYHIILRRTSHPFKSTQPRRVLTIINLFGLVFRKGADDNVVEHFHTCSVDNNDGSGNSFTDKLLYQTHETDAAIKEGKERYTYEDLHNNFSRDVYDLIVAGYSGTCEPRKLSLSEREDLRNKAYKLGLEGKKYDLLFKNRSSARYDSHEKIFRKSYEDGIDARLGRHLFVPRICLYIQGEAGLGKSSGVSYALEQLGYDGDSIAFITNTGNGKYDGISCDTRAIVVDDVVSPNILALFGEYECKLKARYTSAIWQGDIVCVTSNQSFEDWANIKDSSDDADTSNDDTYAALLSRVSICHIATYPNKAPRLVLDRVPQSRYSQQAWDDVQDKYTKFFLSFNKKLEEIWNVRGGASTERKYSKDFIDAVGWVLPPSKSDNDPFVEPSADCPFEV